MFDDNAHKESR